MVISDFLFHKYPGFTVFVNRRYTVHRHQAPLDGDARSAARRLVEELQQLQSKGGRHCVLAGGETTCVVTGKGRGGRNQEIALVVRQLRLTRACPLLYFLSQMHRCSNNSSCTSLSLSLSLFLFLPSRLSISFFHFCRLE